jgi:hypothetical protein
MDDCFDAIFDRILFISLSCSVIAYLDVCSETLRE